MTTTKNSFKVLFAFLLLLSLSTLSNGDQGQATAAGDGSSTPQAQPAWESLRERQQQGQSGSLRGLFGTLFSPISSTLSHAKSLLGSVTDAGTSALGLSASTRERADTIRERTFKIFMQLHNKTYSSPEEIRRRMALFYKRRKAIEQSVREYAEGRLPFMMRENAYVDWDESELKALAGAAPPRTLEEMMPEERQALEVADTQQLSRARRSLPFAKDGNSTHSFVQEGLYFDNDELDDDDEDDDEDGENGNYLGGDTFMIVKQNERIPARKDWRESDCVSTPINQMKCGCCYAIATMSVIETMRCLKTEKSPLLSSQHIIDCSTPRAGYQNFGCDGGWPTRVLKYLQDTKVAATESCYPFKRRQEACRIRNVRNQPGCTVNASPTDTTLRYKVLNNERDILYHVAKTGPVVTVMRATDKFLYYARGVFDDPKCTRRRDDVDHAIVIVGYGRENGMDYWLIKNSWGTTQWGEMGYGKYRRGTNACSIGHWGWVVLS